MAEDNKEKTTAPAPAPEKKSGSNKALTVVIIVIVVLAALGAAGYFGVRYLLNRAGEEVAEGIFESAIDGEVDFDYSEDGATIETEEGTASTGSKAAWPSDMPSSVPKYDEGNLTYSSTTIGGWNLMYEEIGSTSLDSYKSALVDKGWTIVADSSSTVSGNTLQAENDSYDLYVLAFEEGKTATLTVTAKDI